MQRCSTAFLPSRSVDSIARTLVAAAALLVVFGCAAPSPSVVKLEVLEGGLYRVDGKFVEGGVLAEALLAKRRQGKQLLVHVVPAARATYAEVETAVAAARDAGASLGMVGNEQF
jgi:hypothetical protein